MALYSALFYSKAVEEILSDAQWLQQMLRFEASLAQAQARQKLIPGSAAELINACCQAHYLDQENLCADIRLGGNAAIPLVKQLTRIVKNNQPEAAKYVHLGATSQDVVDTATVLQIQVYSAWLIPQLKKLLAALLALSKAHRSTVMIGRTLLQQARPITFGLKVALWADGLWRSLQRLEQGKSRWQTLQLSGAVGSGNSFLSVAIQEDIAEQLQLELGASWQTQRDGLVEWASVLGILSGSLGKIAKDISLLMQTEIAEVFEGAAEGKGGSSTMPHKRNPVTCAAILANATRVPHLVATMHSTLLQEHERSAGLWHAEWETLQTLMGLVGGSLEKTVDLIENLEVHAHAMKANLEKTNGLIYAENLTFALAETLGKSQAHEWVEKACKQAISQQKHLKEWVMETDVCQQINLESVFSAETSIGNSLAILDTIHQKIKL
ncbi:MAG: 3-carboxy-cis,cis-muconate cycloisomerase [Spirosomataceae bacterium]